VIEDVACYVFLCHLKMYKPVNRFPLIIITWDGWRSSWCMKEEQNMKQHDGT